MTYFQAMETRPVTVVETSQFAKQADAIWTPDELAELIDHVARNPEIGTLIPGTGGVRKMRWSRQGVGKRGGARVIYFYYHSDAPIYLLLAYSKAAQADLSLAQKRAVSTLTAALKQHLSVGGA